MSKLETETSAAKTIQAYKDAASQIGLVSEPGNGIDNGDFPRDAYTNLLYIRRVDALGKEHRKIIMTILAIMKVWHMILSFMMAMGANVLHGIFYENYFRTLNFTSMPLFSE